MISNLKNESGIALMLVLASLVVISTVVVEFAYNSHIAYEIAATQRDRLKSEYLARSALNLTRWELSYERQLRQQFASLIQQLSGDQMTQDPFCKLMPLSSGVIHSLASLSGNEQKTEKEDATEKEKKEKPKKPVEESAEESEDPMDLGGDFEGSCDTEERKINLNAFRPIVAQPAEQPPQQGQQEGGQRPQQRSPQRPPVSPQVIYEEQKQLLTSLLSQKELEPYFQDRPSDIQKMVNAIADWVDENDRVDESGGLTGGYEDSEYSDLSYKPKNGRFATKAELLLIPKLGDEIYRRLEPNLTVYGDGRINVCQARDDMILALIEAQSQGAFNPRDEKRVESALKAVRDACKLPNPQPNQLAQAIAQFAGGNTQALAARISTQNRFYSIEAVGTSGDGKVTIRTVLDTEGASPNLWKTLYYRVE